ncbi:MAG: nuclear transport factor 2 family protein [Gemmatimonadaceae bacterium]|nr:nuclear transport factor 2 family protein [Gemmatimonadaceae bacterium]
MRLTHILLAASLLAGSAPLLHSQGASSTASSAASSGPTSPPSVAMPPELDRVLRDYERAWRTRDLAALVSLFTSDGWVLQSGRAPVRGHEALTAAYRGQGGADLKLRALSYASADSIAFIIGGYRYGTATTDMGKFTLTLRRAAGGKWMIFSDMDNGNSRTP